MAPAALAFGEGGAVPAVEFFNVYIGHYFVTIDTAEMADIDAGKAGPGWVRTGYTFGAYTVPPPAIGTCCAPLADVTRFYSRQSNSHFYTADAVEAAGLNHPGSEWAFEKLAFAIAIPDASGTCPAPLLPIYRFYNNRFAFSDSNHRYVTSQAERDRMRALGWIDEGVRWCTPFAADTPIKSFAITTVDAPSKIRPSAQCEDESLNIGPCIAVNNLATPNQPMWVQPPPYPGSPTGYEFYDRVGLGSTPIAYVVDSSLSAADAAADVFVQQTDNIAFGAPSIGIHVDTLHRGPNDLSSVNPLYQLHNDKGPDLRDDRFFPFGAYESDVELAISFELTVHRLMLRSDGGAAYGHPTLEFVDTKSGRHVYFTVLTYGTVPSGDYLAPDTGTGKVIVGTTFRANASYGRSIGDSFLPTPAPFSDPDISPSNHGVFEFRMTRDDFRHVLADARTLDPALSSDPADYLLDNFHFNNEVYKDGEIGLVLQNYRVTLFRR